MIATRGIDSAMVRSRSGLTQCFLLGVVFIGSVFSLTHHTEQEEGGEWRGRERGCEDVQHRSHLSQSSRGGLFPPNIIPIHKPLHARLPPRPSLCILRVGHIQPLSRKQGIHNQRDPLLRGANCAGQETKEHPCGLGGRKIKRKGEVACFGGGEEEGGDTGGD